MTDSIRYISSKAVTSHKNMGKGDVYQANWAGKDVAVRRVHIKKNEEKEFVRETSEIAKLKSPGIVRLQGICVEPGHYAMVMDLMPNGNLCQMLSRKEDLPWGKRWRLAEDISLGLSYLHSQYIVHGNLKSSSIWLDKDWRAKISGFGLAVLGKRLKEDVRWMAPELFVKQPVFTAKTDVYALGMVLWEIASKRIPFDRTFFIEDVTKWVQKGIREDIPQKCPLSYAKIIDRCWKQSPEERPTAAISLHFLQQKKEPPAEAEEWSCLNTFKAHDKAVNALTSIGEGKIASGSSDKTIKIWEIKSGQCLSILEGHSEAVNALVYLGNGVIASASLDSTVKIWNIESGKCLKTLKGHKSEVKSLLYLGQDRIASGSSDTTVKIWNTKSGKWVSSLDHHYKGPCPPLARVNSCTIISGSWDTIKSWMVPLGSCNKTFQAHHYGVVALAHLGRGRVASVGTYESAIKIWDQYTGKQLGTLVGHKKELYVLAHLGGGKLASGGVGKIIKIWNRYTGVCLATLTGHQGFICALERVSQDSFASGSYDGVVKIWKKTS